jgi:outer membrane protein assembly factor BamB
MAPVKCVDEDGDRYVPGSASPPTCSDLVPRLPGDCDDHDPDIHASALEACDGTDEDCDGKVDEGLACSIRYDSVTSPLESPLGEPIVFSGRDGVVYLYQSPENQLLRLDPASPAAWMNIVPNDVRSPVFEVDPERTTLYVGSSVVRALDTKSGEQKWLTTGLMRSSAAALALASDGLYVGGDRFLAKLRPDGEQDLLVPVPESEIIDIAVANDGALALIARVTAYLVGPTQLGPCAIARTREEFQSFAVYIDAAGGCGWVRPVLSSKAASNPDELKHVAFTQDGAAVILAGSPVTGSELPGIKPAAPRDTGGSSNQNQEVLIAALERDGTLRWLKTVDNPNDLDSVTALDVSSSGVVVGLQLEKFAGATYSHGLGYVLELDPETGQERWRRDFYKPNVISDEQRFTIRSLARAADGSLYVVAGKREILHVFAASTTQ